MAKTVGEAKVTLEGDLSKLKKSLDEGEKVTNKWTGVMAGLFTGLFVTGIGIAIAKMVSIITDGLKIAAAKTKELFKSAVLTVDDELKSVRMLGAEINDLERAQVIFDEFEEKAIAWKVANDDLFAGYVTLNRFFDEGFATTAIEDIANASRYLGLDISRMARDLSTVAGGLLSSRKLVELGISKDALSDYGIEFDPEDQDKIISDNNAVVDAILAIWHDKYTEGVGTEMTLASEYIQALKNQWGQALEAIGRAGIYDLVIEKLSEIVSWIEENKAQIHEWAGEVSGFFSSMIEEAEKWLGLDFSEKTLQGGTENRGTFGYEAKTPEEIAIFALGFTQQEYEDAIAFMDNPWEFGEGMTQEERDELVENWRTLTEAIEAESSKIGQIQLETPEWAAKIDEFVETIKVKFQEGGISEVFSKIIEDAFSDNGVVSKAAALGGQIGEAFFDGMEKAMEKNHPVLYNMFFGGWGENAEWYTSPTTAAISAATGIYSGL